MNKYNQAIIDLQNQILESSVDLQEKELAEKDLEDEELCACGNYKMDESDFCEDCI
jgi:hypothetical protein